MAKQHTLRHGFFCAAALAALVLTACGGQDTRVVQSGADQIGRASCRERV